MHSATAPHRRRDQSGCGSILQGPPLLFSPLPNPSVAPRLHRSLLSLPACPPHASPRVGAESIHPCGHGDGGDSWEVRAAVLGGQPPTFLLYIYRYRFREEGIFPPDAQFSFSPLPPLPPFARCSLVPDAHAVPEKTQTLFQAAAGGAGGGVHGQ